jgi:signal transduction histidine kinase
MPANRIAHLSELSGWITASPLLSGRQGQATTSPPGAGNPPARTTIQGIQERALGWWALGGLGYRVVLTPFLMANLVAVWGSAASRYIWVLAVLLAVDVGLLAGLATGRLRWLLRSNLFLAADVLVAVALNLWMSASVPHGSLNDGGRDIFWWYAIGTVGLWTGLRGARTGVAMVAGAGLLELAMVRANGATLGLEGWMQLLWRYVWMWTALGLALLVMRLARLGAGLAVDAGLRAGRAAQRADMLRQLHDTVLQTLEGLALRTGSGLQSLEERLGEVRTIAVAQAQELRAVLSEDRAAADRAAAGGALGVRFRALAARFQRHGLRVDLLTAMGSVPDLPGEVLDAVEGAVREALTNVAKHAGVTRAAVQAEATGDGVAVTVCDHGRGFDPAAVTGGYGLAGSIRARLAQVGGTAEVWSAPGRGTRVRLRVGVGARPAWSRLATRWAGVLSGRFAGQQTAGSGVASTASVGALAAQTFGWFALAVLVYRVVVIPITGVNVPANLPGEVPLGALAVVLGGLLAANLVLLAAAVSGRPSGLLESNALLGTDVVVAVAVSLWVAAVMPHGNFFLIGHDAFMPYVLSVVVLWTTLRGARTGLVLLAGAAVLELAMGLVNGVGLAAVAWPELASRLATSCLAVALPLVVMAAARHGGRLQAAEGLRAGRETERARLLADTHERALQTLETIAARAGADDPPTVRVREVQALARSQAAELRAILHADGEHPHDGLVAGLQALASQSRRDGLAIELVTNQLGKDPGRLATAALLEATREVLGCAVSGEAHRVVIRAVTRPDGVEVTVRGHGDGSHPNGHSMVSDRIGEGVRRAGGRMEVWSTPGRGTRVTLWAPS